MAADESSFTGLFQEAPSQTLRDRYVVKETLATSRVSAVYRVADNMEPGTSFVVKELSTVALFRAEEKRTAEQAFRGAVQRWSAVQHPALVRILDTFSERGKYYVVLEYVPGWSLKKLIEENRVRATPDLARNWGAQLADLAAHLHAQTPPLYLPFLAPNHVMVTADGQVKLVDLGLTHIFSPNSYGPYGSTHGYMAPELESGSPGVFSDIFGLGRLLYALLTGYLLEKGLPKQMTLRQAVPGISPQLVRIIAKAANRDPEARFSSMLEFGRALWDEMEGPLEPIQGWLQQPNQVTRVTQPSLAPRAVAGAQETMADLGFQRDVRFGPEATEPIAPRKAPLDAGAPGEAKLSIYPRTFSVSDLKPNEVRRLVLVLRNAGAGDLSVRAVSHVAWLSAPSKVVTLSPGKQARVLLSLRAAAVVSGRTSEPQALAVESDAGRQWVGLETDVATGPLLQIDPSTHDLGMIDSDAEQTWHLVLVNAGRQPLTAQIGSRVPWLRTPQGDLRCAGESTIRVPITLVPSRLPRGEQRVSGALVIDSDGGQAQIEVRAWRVRPELDLGANHIDLGATLAGEVAERFLYVRNIGEGTLDGVARSLVPWLQVHPQQFTCPPQEMVQLTVNVDTVGLADGLIDVPQALRIQSNGGNQTLSLRLQVRAPKLALGASQLSFGTVPMGETREQRITVRNEGSAPLDCTIQSLVGWLTSSDSVIHCEPASATDIKIRADTGFFKQGQQVEPVMALRVVCGAEIVELPASITVLQPTLRVEPGEIDFGYIDRSQPETRTLLIANDGTGRLAWNVQSDAVWTEITPRSGVCEAGESAMITLTAYGLALEGENASGVVVVNSDGGRAKVPMHAGLAAPNLASDTTLLDLGTSVNLASVGGSFRIFNYGLGVLRGSISSDHTWLVVDRASFEVPTGRSVEIRLSTDMEEFPAGQSYASGRILVISNGGNTDIEVALNVELAAVLEASGSVVSLRRTDTGALEGRIALGNRGLATGHVELAASHPQLRLSRSVFDIKPGKSVRVGVEWETSGLAAEAGLYIDASYAMHHIRIPVEINEDKPGTSALVSQTRKEAQQ